MGVTTVIMGLLILSRKLALRILAALILLSLVAYCIGAVIVPLYFWDMIPHDLISLEDLRMLGPPAIMIGSGILFLGAFFLCFGSGAIQWILAVLCILIGATVPWLPVEEYLPESPGAPVVVEFEKLNIVLPEIWMRVTPKDDTGEKTGQFFRTLDGELSLHLTRAETEAGIGIREFAEIKLEEYRGEQPVASFDVPGNPSQKRLVVLGEQRVEVLITKRPDAFYCVELSGPSAAFKSKQDVVKNVFSLFD